MNFGKAIEALKEGKKVARMGWNGKNMFLWLKPATTLKSDFLRDPILKQVVEDNGGTMDALGTICMKTADNKVLTGWLASKTDMLSDDWMVVGSEASEQKKEDKKSDKEDKYAEQIAEFQKAANGLNEWVSNDKESRSFILIVSETHGDDHNTSCAVVGKEENNVRGVLHAKNDEETSFGEILHKSSFVEFLAVLSKIK